MGAILTERQHGSGIPAQWLRRYVPHRRKGKFRITKDESSSRIGAGLIDRGVDGSGHGGRPVGEPPSFLATCPPASGTVRHCTTWRSNACRPQRPAQVAGRVFWDRMPSPKHGELIGRMNKSRDDGSHFAIGQSFPIVAAPPGLTRPGGAAALDVSAVVLRRSEGAKSPRMSAFEPLHLFGQYPQRPVDLDVLVYALDGAGAASASVGRACGQSTLKGSLQKTENKAR